MKTYPYMDGDRLIELVERRELDAANAEIARLTALLNPPDPYQTDEYQQYVAECAKCCECSNEICESVLAGAPCEMRIHEDDEY